MHMRALLAASLFTAASPPLVLLAQPAPNQTQLDEVVVTTQGVGAGSLAGTGPVAEVGASDIRARQSGSLASALREVPGVHSARGDNLLSAGLGLRGFGGNNVMPSDANLQINLDGASANGGSNYRNSGTMIIDPALIKRITVRKGPLASLEFGSGLAGGVINAETINAGDLTGGAPGLRFRQMMGANSNGRGWVTSSTLAWQPDEQLELLFNATRRAQKAQKDGNGAEIGAPGSANRFADTTNSFNVPSYLLKARYSFGPDRAHALTFSHSYSESAERNVSYGQTHNAGFGTVNRDRKGTTSTLTYSYAPGHDLIDLEVAFSRARHRMAIDVITAPAAFAGIYDLATDRFTVKNTARFQTGGIAHALRAGIELSRSQRDNLSGVTNPGRDQRRALFALDEMSFGDGWKATLGARVEAGKLMPRGGAAINQTARTLGLGLEKDFGTGLSVFGSATYGENLPTLDTLTGPNADRKQKSRTYEAGLHYRAAGAFAAGDSLSAALTVYHTTVWDAQSYTQSSVEGFKYKGLEASLSYSHSAGYYARASATLADNREQTAARVWRDYAYSPANSAALTLGKRWSNGFDLSLTSRANAAITLNGSRAPGWAVQDLALSYTPQSGVLQGATLNIGVENLFDKGYRSNLSTLNEPGRNLKISLAKTF